MIIQWMRGQDTQLIQEQGKLLAQYILFFACFWSRIQFWEWNCEWFWQIAWTGSRNERKETNAWIEFVSATEARTRKTCHTWGETQLYHIWVAGRHAQIKHITDICLKSSNRLRSNKQSAEMQTNRIDIRLTLRWSESSSSNLRPCNGRPLHTFRFPSISWSQVFPLVRLVRFEW